MCLSDWCMGYHCWPDWDEPKRQWLCFKVLWWECRDLGSFCISGTLEGSEDLSAAEGHIPHFIRNEPKRISHLDRFLSLATIKTPLTPYPWNSHFLLPWLWPGVRFSEFARSAVVGCTFLNCHRAVSECQASVKTQQVTTLTYHLFLWDQGKNMIRTSLLWTELFAFPTRNVASYVWLRGQQLVSCSTSFSPLSLLHLINYKRMPRGRSYPRAF